MMDQVDLGKLIFVNGPSFGGKTYLVNKLLGLLCKDFKVSIVNFESVYEENTEYSELKRRFINVIEGKRKFYDVVIAESTIINYGIDNFLIILNPSYEIHINRFNEYKKEFGEFDSNRRIYFPTLGAARNHFNNIYNINCKNNILIEDNLNFVQIEEIKKYVSSS